MYRKSMFVAFLLLLLMVFGTVFAASPYSDSSVITGISFNWATHQELAPGSDNWPVTWADNGHQYSSWGDGGGFGGTNTDGRVSLGFARIEGAKSSYTGYNVWGGKNPENPAIFDGKCYGIICINGVLYAWRGPGSGVTSYDEARLYKSINHGASWSATSVEFLQSDDIIMPTILNFGQNYAGARDNYVYHYFIDLVGNPSNLGVHVPGKIYLLRVDKTHIEDESYYEFFSGTAASPSWSGSISSRTPVFEDPAGVGWNLSVSYNAPLGRYILCTEHTQAFQGRLGMFDAPEPWGPWTTVLYTDNFHTGAGDDSFFWNFSNKWLSPDGKDFVLVFTGINGDDSWNTVEGSFTTSSPSAAAPYQASSVITSVSWDWSSHISQAPGSDNWPVTWADDDNQYSSWGDGGGFGGTNTDGRVSLGFARIEGNKDSYTGYNVWGGKNPEHSATFNGKSYGILCVEGVLYAFVNENSCGACSNRLCKSTNHGASWTKASWTVPSGGGDSTFLQFGMNYAGARDNYVYIYSPMDPASDPGTEVWLARVPKDQIMTWASWEFYTGISGGNPTWTSSWSGRQAVFEDSRVGWCLSVTYNAGLNRYILCSTHEDSITGSGLGIFDAPEPWGPWTTVIYYTDWGGYSSGGSTFSYYFSNKWTSTDGLNSVLVWSGTGARDSWNTLECAFIANTTTLAASIDAPADGSDSWYGESVTL